MLPQHALTFIIIIYNKHFSDLVPKAADIASQVNTLCALSIRIKGN